MLSKYIIEILLYVDACSKQPQEGWNFENPHFRKEWGFMHNQLSMKRSFDQYTPQTVPARYWS